MDKALTTRSLVILYLQNPREKVWGVLLSMNTFGITLRGIDVYSFDDWSRCIASQTESIGLTTMFIPMMRLEKIVLDETAGGYIAFSEQFKERVGHDVREFLGVPDSDDDPKILN